MSPALIAGLGNPGEAYAATRHNIGFLVVEELARRAGADWCEERGASVATAGSLRLLRPLTYMNRSGFAVRRLVEAASDEAPSVLVVFDDIALPLGRLRLRGGGGAGGHRGMESVLENLRTAEVPRLRVGVRCPGDPEPGEEDLSPIVLGPFPEDEVARVRRVVAAAADACESWLEHGLEPTMSRYNGLEVLAEAPATTEAPAG